MINILIADDHAVVRRGLKQIVAEQSDMQVLGEAQNVTEVFQLLRQREWDVIMLDLNMPGGSGLEVLGDLKEMRPDIAVLILTIHPEDQFAMRVLKAGAAGYLTKESAPDQLVLAIRKAYAGGKYVSPTLAELMVETLGSVGDRLPHEGLSNREYEVLCLIGAGKTMTTIADHLQLSIKTISTYRTRLLDKMGLSTNAELMHYVLSKGLAQA
jgi:two-component system, NarL family, invasion response regulator UvrY